MATLPPSTDFTGSSVTEAGGKVFISTLRTFIADLLGTNSGDKAAARAALGLSIGADVQAYNSAIPTSIVSQAEAEAGTATTGRTWTAQRVRQAIFSPSAASVPVRQTVLSGPVDSSGYSAFGGSTGSTTVTASGTLKATAAAGDTNYTGSITNPSWTGLSTNGTMYLYLDITSAGVVTTGSTTLQPAYRWGGADVTTNGQFTFNIQEMIGKVGNGSAATQVYRVFVGEATISGGVVSAIVWYALMGRYVSADTSFGSLGTKQNFNHNLGVQYGALIKAQAVCQSTELGWTAGEIADVIFGAQNAGGILSGSGTSIDSRLACSWMNAITYQLMLVRKTDGVVVGATASSWKLRIVVQRGW